MDTFAGYEVHNQFDPWAANVGSYSFWTTLNATKEYLNGTMSCPGQPPAVYPFVTNMSPYAGISAAVIKTIDPFPALNMSDGTTFKGTSANTNIGGSGLQATWDFTGSGKQAVPKPV